MANRIVFNTSVSKMQIKERPKYDWIKTEYPNLVAVYGPELIADWNDPRGSSPRIKSKLRGGYFVILDPFTHRSVVYHQNIFLFGKQYYIDVKHLIGTGDPDLALLRLIQLLEGNEQKVWDDAYITRRGGRVDFDPW